MMDYIETPICSQQMKNFHIEQEKLIEGVLGWCIMDTPICSQQMENFPRDKRNWEKGSLDDELYILRFAQ